MNGPSSNATEAPLMTPQRTLQWLGVPDRFAKLHQIGALPSPLRQ